MVQFTPTTSARIMPSGVWEVQSGDNVQSFNTDVEAAEFITGSVGFPRVDYGDVVAMLVHKRREHTTVPAGLGPWEAALWRFKALAHGAGIPEDQTDHWAIKHDESGLSLWGAYLESGDFYVFLPAGTPDAFVAMGKRLYG